MNKPEKVLEILHEKQFNNKKPNKNDTRDDVSVGSRADSEKGLTKEESTL